MPLTVHSFRLDHESITKLGALTQERGQTAGEVVRSLIKNARLKDKNSRRILREGAKLRRG